MNHNILLLQKDDYVKKRIYPLKVLSKIKNDFEGTQHHLTGSGQLDNLDSYIECTM